MSGLPLGYGQRRGVELLAWEGGWKLGNWGAGVRRLGIGCMVWDTCTDMGGVGKKDGMG